MGVWLDDEFPEHPKIEAMGNDLAAWLYVAGLCYCVRNLTGGRIPKVAALRLTNTASKKLIALLLAEHLPGRGPLWEDHGDHYRPHNYEWRQSSAEKRRAEVEDGKKKRSEHARKAAEARWAAEEEARLAALAEHQSSINRASPEHPPGIDSASPGAVLGDAHALARPRVAHAADPSPNTPVNRSSSSLDRVDERTAEEEEPDVGGEACLAVATGRLRRRAADLPPIGAPELWLERTVATLRTQHADLLATMVAAGKTAAEIAAAIDPPAANGVRREQGEPVFDEVFDEDAGEWRLARVAP